MKKVLTCFFLMAAAALLLPTVRVQAANQVNYEVDVSQDFLKTDENASDILRSDSPSDGTVIDVVANNPDLTTFIKAVNAADLKATLKVQGPFTIFAPSNSAFNKLPPGKLDELLKPENKEQLRNILKSHVVSGNIKSDDLKNMQAKTINGKILNVRVEGDTVMVEDAKVVNKNFAGSNGVVHVIDTIIAQ